MTIDEPHEDPSVSMYNYLKDAAAAGELIRIEKGALPEYANVPLVMYLGGERTVIGEATIEGDVITGVFGPEAGPDVMNRILGDSGMRFSLASDEDIPPFESEPVVLEEMLDKPVYTKPFMITACPFLKGEHNPEDDCGPLGHKDKEGEDGST